MNTISFMSANFVARELNYHLTGGWMEGDRATNDYFRPPETFAGRFGALLAEVAAMGFRAVDLWIAHLNPGWATADHIRAAREQLAAHDLTVTSLAGWYGDTPEEAAAYCRLAVAVGAPIIGGHIPLLDRDRAATVAILDSHGIRLGIENHPEKNAAEFLERIGAGGPVGACVDTGWFGTHGYPADRALAELAPHLVHVHLKDVRAAGSHDTCRFGDGVVPIRGCVDALKQAGYTGAISIEHEPDNYDPTEDVKASLAMLERWLT